jgi:hypothetical protein
LYCLNPLFHATVLTTNTTQTSMPPVGFEPTIPVSERPKTHALDCTVTGIGSVRTPASPASSVVTIPITLSRLSIIFYVVPIFFKNRTSNNVPIIRPIGLQTQITENVLTPLSSLK